MRYFDPYEQRRQNSPIYADYMARWRPSGVYLATKGWAAWLFVVALLALAWALDP